MNRRHILLIVTLVLAAVAMAPATAAADTGQSPLYQLNESTNTTTVDASNDSDAPGTAERLRVSPITFNEDWINTRTLESDTEFNTSGPFALFSLSEPAENVRITQSGAEAQLTQGDQTLRIDYTDEAAESGSTYFQAELFFADGSSTTVDLYATQTSVSAQSTEWAAYSDLIEDMEDDATERGYEATPEGLTEYHGLLMDRTELVESFLIERLDQLLATAILLGQNPLAWLILLSLIGFFAYKHEKEHGQYLDRIENGAGKTARKIQQLKTAYKENIETANEESAAVMPEVDEQQHRYFRDAFDAYSVRQMAELSRRGPRSLDTDAVTDGGEDVSAISQIDADNIHDSWLAKVFSSNRLSDPLEALSCMRAALRRMESTYGMGHKYTDARADIEELIDDVKEAESGF